MFSCSNFYGNCKKPKPQRLNASSARVMDHDVDHTDNIILIPDADVSDASTDSDLSFEIREPISAGSSDEPDEIPQPNVKARSKSKKSDGYKWISSPKKKTIELEFLGDSCSFDDELKDIPDYFTTYFSEEMVKVICEMSNIYAAEKKSNFYFQEEKVWKLLGILLKMGILGLPRYEMHWSTDFRVGAIADVMSKNDFKKCMQFMHFCRNFEIITCRNDPNYDPFAKIRPLLDIFRQNCLTMPSLQEQSIDEQVIKFKGRHSMKQYIPNKPTKRGFKVFSRNGADGFMHDFSLYDGKKQETNISCGYEAGDVVIKLSETLAPNKNYLFFYDNWFNFPELQRELKKNGIYSCGTIRADRVRGLPLTSEKELKKEGRGSFRCHTDQSSETTKIQWNDNKRVQIATNFAGVHPFDEVRRWSKSQNRNIQVKRPNAISLYNEYMGGVDLFDMMSSFYKIDHRSKKYYRRIFFWVLGSALVNGWLHYKRHCASIEIAKREQLDMLSFTTQVSNVLCTGNPQRVIIPRSVKGRPRSVSANENAEACEPQRKKVVLVPDSVRCSSGDHFPQMVEKRVRRRCRQCQALSQIQCMKCQVSLCLQIERNCFVEYHK